MQALELRGTKAQLQAATDELETRIEDMKSTTEEFQAVTEELQSSNEELETSKEEMQSINEELQTINSELNNKQELLTRANSDLQNLLGSTQIAVLFLDDQLGIRHFTPALTQLFPVRESDHGRPITDIATELDYTEIQADAEKVQRDGSIVERDLALKNSNQAFVMRIRPYRKVDKGIDGVVITFVDITERKLGEERHLLLTRELQHRTNNLLAVILSVAQQSLSGTLSLDKAREALTARLNALAKANGLLTLADWHGAAIKDVIAHELASFMAHVSIEGPQVVLTPNATQSFALVIHELATNATKHGALSTPDGKVAARWSVEGTDEPRLVFRWEERGGPRVAPPTHEGFGTTLLKNAFSGGEIAPRIEYAPAGFSYTLEAALSAVAAIGRDSGRPAQQGETILVVEDDPDVLRLVVEELTYIGYRVLIATNADEALNIIRRNDEIDVLFSDIHMPGGMNGVQLTVEAHRLRPALKVLLTSGYPAALRDQDIPGEMEVLRKPYQPDELAQKLRLVISR